MKSGRSIVRGLLVLAVLVLSGGCMPPLAGSSSPMRAGSTYLLHLPGIAGDTPFDRWWIDAIAQEGAADRVELFDWTCHDPWIHALQAYGRNHEEARKVADLIGQWHRRDRAGKIILTAESGGTGVLVWALELLPKDVQVDAVVLVAPAISPGYDLSRALAHVRGRMYYFDSPGDWWVLGLGTRTFGTMDGKNVNSAGFVGFHEPPDADPAEYEKLVEIKYEQRWWWWGNFGGHTGAMSITFAEKYIAPLLKHALQEERHSSRLPQTVTESKPLSRHVPLDGSS